MLKITHKDVKAKPESGCYVYGLYLEGCKWDYDSEKLADSDPKKLFVDMPMIHFMPIQNREVPKTGIYNCPVYKVLSRNGTLSTTGHSTNFVLDLELPSMDHEDKWIRAGVACFLALKYWAGKVLPQTKSLSCWLSSDVFGTYKPPLSLTLCRLLKSDLNFLAANLKVKVFSIAVPLVADGWQVSY